MISSFNYEFYDYGSHKLRFYIHSRNKSYSLESPLMTLQILLSFEKTWYPVSEIFDETNRLRDLLSFFITFFGVELSEEFFQFFDPNLSW